jgi:hypothetical protein
LVPVLVWFQTLFPTSISVFVFGRPYAFSYYYYKLLCYLTASVVWWSEFLAPNPEVPGSILEATRFSEQQWVWNEVHSALVRINEELLERKVAAPV